MPNGTGRVFLFIFLSLIAVIAIFGVYTYNVLSRITGGEDFSHEELFVDYSFIRATQEENQPQGSIRKPPHIFIAVFGIDKRYVDEFGRSDTNLLVKVDFLKRKIKLVSIMRDLLVEIPGHGRNKFNAAFAYGEAKLALGTLNLNFALGIVKYVIVDFQVAEKLIDAVGGVTIEVKPEELEQLNLCIKELARLAKDNYVPLVRSPGVHLLNGRQAVGYARIRKVGMGDYERTRRQQRVLTELFKKAKLMSLTTKFRLLDLVSHSVRTNLTLEELKALAFEDYNSYELETLRIPVWGTFREETVNINGVPSFVLNADLEKNKELLQKFLLE
ncbi:LCP family protein [Fervidobacterium thailandense]|uniref:Cell envelope-related transcriptional attenuator domain-containing protein n=1 Tax=Fervidobacterium thailandense TaxID=1008305 RepID=A0A1E3G0H6_9BACT|nr:LCP family protein [Fervidobacterium thailandense]ODN29722.1 hypothetical protein A4H02_09295 [Fervidobacterium thailandense]